MKNELTNQLEDLLEFQGIATESIHLSLEKVEQAIQISNQIPNESRQWQTYLNGLALFGFEQWLEERGKDNLTVNLADASIFNPVLSNSIPAVCNLNINQFKVCIITQGSFINEEVSLPRAVVDLPEFSHHLYVVVEVQEELEKVVINSFISYADLMGNKTQLNLLPDEDWNYQIPWSWFDTEIDNLLLYLRCLDIAGIALPEVQPKSNNLAAAKAELTKLLPQLSAQNLWESFNWEQGKTILTNSELLNWIYNWQLQIDIEEGNIPNNLVEITENSENSLSSLSKYLPDLLSILTEPTINVGRWLKNELDDFANELSWVLLPELSALSPMRGISSPTEEIAGIIRELPKNGVYIPPHARVAYHDLLLAGIPLRLYALTWSLVSDSTLEWMLLLILSTPTGMGLPEKIKLRVSDATGILVEQKLNSNEDDFYIFTNVVGGWNEKFIATVYLTPENQETFPPFEFNP
ncbi:MAG: DUF1822 family protein [Okeania sp. SIO2G4]|uniref:DUF1822 family protein n=1 Tax=unclassified Okeania TaxID=2634635 RepID=UPI0013B96855|nr:MULTISPECIES: DUF1822 family protein [unclassified Okeania]NEP38537.1 DUF1822 family protein [Okeania sp. SIO2H7]NEP74760.1 DUF1822 family protein [Okeania sp. SIO2G5]NEP95785.1 DUF1822 family protein [Okeania sp. SIO2F5]NEQ93563.1 DUF1822 family protein [Okeania sp. SIO2G4]